ncbi:TPA: 3-oxoacyl-ACP reductase FabG [Pseudomonas putida]|jgi:3-oxoacyl-[acyl-carrier protein] reductase|uniref:Short-chain dehydrogenase/reductase SDR n=1 Tax=Pseudomonas putida (strain GB-1) TaxID=76869 RepID=B0KIC1_PSEPG|nr:MULTISPECIES: 3-oxoacyl-ACP reductase FabG [Pseudomonas]ABY97697.1 short-chain dehydrogenase/reductase SDR [Pseudomonas putida GB-1]APE98080.1 3-oxoacyl-ACP reductase [Pseudomonas putida]MBP0710747.1 3-oxoacyl-ACP reductase FabG [Pseudomonas sp. T34]MCE1003698.1 3-oxoacyl-ACP reductase FabG [Pseudomonas sp. NMI1173_11]MCK2190194.1 3-oxoacyl-ACP reductase FabG [Pseudomonas sp. MB04B]
MLTSLQGKSVLVTGGTSGIGLGIAVGFARQGAKVAISGRHRDKVEAVASRLRDQGLAVIGLVADVGDRAQVLRMIEEVAQAQGGLDVLCANAGVFPSAALAEMSDTDWDKVLGTNAKGTFLCVQAALPYLRRAEYGRVILTSSITGPVTGFPGWAHYGASKAAQLGFMRTAAIELARDGITINALLPGNIVTEGLQGMGEDYQASMAASIPLKRLGQVEDIANAALFFASREAGYITGQSLIIDGGQILPESLQALA